MASPALTSRAVSRREFLVVMGGAVLSFGFARHAQLIPAAGASVADGDVPAERFDPTLWFSMDDQGRVTVNIIRAEMGQHVGTALARILADELEVDWSSVSILHVDTDPKWGEMVTGGSWSVWQTWPVFSRAGAAGRIALVEAGAALLGTVPSACVARDGAVVSGKRSIAYAEIVRRGTLHRQYSMAELDKIPVKSAEQHRLVGRSVDALDIPAKINGAAIYGIDAKREGMVYARPKLPPTRNDSVVKTVDDKAARTIPGYIKTIVLEDPSNTVPGWVMVIASTYPAAVRACDLVVVDWDAGPSLRVAEHDLLDRGRKQIASPVGGTLLNTDNSDTAPAFRGAHDVLERTYTTSTVLHFQLEPVNALAFEKDGVFEIHTGNQWQTLILPTLAKALRRPVASIVMRTYLVGGGFGRRLNGDYAVPAALASKALGRPVKMILTREDDARFDSVRSASVQTLRVAFGADQTVRAMEHHASAGWPTEVIAPAFLAKGQQGRLYDPFAISGADHWYDVGAHKVRALSNDLANATFRPGYLRSVGPGWTNWAVESFMDECAHHLAQDPLAFRLGLLTGNGRNAGSSPNAVGGAHRQAEVLRRVAERAGWTSAQPKDTALGIATSFGQERAMPTWVACVARVHVNRSDGTVTVEKLTLVVDAGTVIDPRGANAQVEGSSLWGLSMALHEGTSFTNGQVEDTNLVTYTPLRMRDVPEVDISFVESAEAPVGLGEPGTTVVAPAIANAIYAAVGVRVRHIPMRPRDLLAAMDAGDNSA